MGLVVVLSNYLVQFPIQYFNLNEIFNSFFSERFQKNRAGQMIDLSNFLKTYISIEAHSCAVPIRDSRIHWNTA